MKEHFVYGIHAVTALLHNPHRKIHQLFIHQEGNNARLKMLQDLAEQQKIPVELLSLQKMQQRYADFNHQGVVASAMPLPEYTESSLPQLLETARKPAFILILDGITDPHNLGACLRTADAVGIDFVIIPKDNNVGITPVVSKTASGALESIPLVRVTNLVRAIEVLKKQGIWIYGAALEAEKSIYELKLEKTSVALVFGAEGKGLRRLTREHCDDLFSLPMQGTVESLNVSVAAAVAMYEILRQRKGIYGYPIE